MDTKHYYTEKNLNISIKKKKKTEEKICTSKVKQKGIQIN